jgi:amino acid permease
MRRPVQTYIILDFLLTVTTIMKTVIGAGILSLPYTVSKLGYIFSLIVFTIVITMNQFSARLLLKAKNMSKHSNYSTILYHIYHHRISKALGSIFIFLNNIGICNYNYNIGIAELTIFKEAIRKII